MSARHTLHVDWTRCDGRGLCAELLAGTIARDEWGYPFAVGAAADARSDIRIRSDQLEAAEDAVALCPVLALRLRRVG
jgi:ferredoxin